MPITRSRRCKHNSNSISPKMECIERQGFFQITSRSRLYDCEHFEHTLYLSFATIQREKLTMRPIHNHTQRQILTQKIRGNGSSNRYAIFYCRIFPLALLDTFIPIYDYPSIHSGIQSEL